jgi:hypothetical protein
MCPRVTKSGRYGHIEQDQGESLARDDKVNAKTDTPGLGVILICPEILLTAYEERGFVSRGRLLLENFGNPLSGQLPETLGSRLAKS